MLVQDIVNLTIRITENPGGISRLNSLFFVYNFSSEGLIKTAKSVVAYYVVKSSADIREVDDNTLRVLVNQCFETLDLSLRRAIYGLRRAHRYPFLQLESGIYRFAQESGRG